jgi:hypothetical protein
VNWSRGWGCRSRRSAAMRPIAVNQNARFSRALTATLHCTSNDPAKLSARAKRLRRGQSHTEAV